MAQDKSGPGQACSYKGIFSTPFGNAVSGNNVVTGSSNAPLAKTFDYGNATKGFDVSEHPGEKGNGIIEGPGTAGGKQDR